METEKTSSPKKSTVMQQVKKNNNRGFEKIKINFTLLIFFQISQTQHSLELSRYRIEVLERTLKYREMPIEER